jgi:hypothetical protein
LEKERTEPHNSLPIIISQPQSKKIHPLEKAHMNKQLQEWMPLAQVENNIEEKENED